MLASILLNLVLKVLNKVKYLPFSSGDQERKTAQTAEVSGEANDKSTRILLIML